MIDTFITIMEDIPVEEHLTRKYLILIFIELIIGAIISVIIIFFDGEVSFRSIMDGIGVSGIILCLFGIIMLLANIGIYETIEWVIMYLAALIRKKPFDISFFEAVYLREKRSAITHRTILISSFIYMVTGGIMYAIYYTQMV